LCQWHHHRQTWDCKTMRYDADECFGHRILKFDIFL
jgi:hypothetical protein